MIDQNRDDRLLAFLTAAQLSDSFFPTGGYAHSYGLEALASRGLIRGAADLRELVENQLAWSVVPSDGVALLNAYRIASREPGDADLDEVAAVDRLLFAMKLPRELRAGSAQLGRRLLAETIAFEGGPCRAAYSRRCASGLAPGLNPIVLALVAVDLAVPVELAFGVMCHGYIGSVLGAALRLLPISHRDAQAIRREVQSNVRDLYREVAGRDWRDMMSFSPELDAAATAHPTDDVRMFAS